MNRQGMESRIGRVIKEYEAEDWDGKGTANIRTRKVHRHELRQVVGLDRRGNTGTSG